jgi:hypothetical protein
MSEIKQANGEYLIYNGIRNRDVIDTFGTKKLGIETMPALITRGILIDVAGFKDVEYLDAGYAWFWRLFERFAIEFCALVEHNADLLLITCSIRTYERFLASSLSTC